MLGAGGTAAHWRQGLALWARWVLANATAVALGLILPCGFFALAAIGAAAQWLALRRWRPDLLDWPLVTAGGILVGFPFLSWAFFDPANRADWVNTILFALFPGVVGLAQWFALRTRARRAGWWIAASAVGGALFWPVHEATWRVAGALYNEYPIRWITARHVYFTFSGYGEPSSAEIVTWFLQGTVGGAAYGAVTGLALIWLLRGAAPRMGQPVAVLAGRE